MIQWLRLRASSGGGTGLIPAQGTKISHDNLVWQKKRKRNKEKKRMLVESQLDKESKILIKALTHIYSMTK